MNERIKELAEQTEKWIRTTNFEGKPEDEMTYDELYNKKFAELIVKECIQVIKNESMDSGDEWEDGLCMAEDAIKHNFGVE